jgi:aconitate hydratase
VEAGILADEPIDVLAEDGANCLRFQVRAQVLTHAERELMVAGGIPSSMLRYFMNS